MEHFVMLSANDVKIISMKKTYSVYLSVSISVLTIYSGHIIAKHFDIDQFKAADLQNILEIH